MFSKTCRDCALVAGVGGAPINLGCRCDPGNRYTYLEIDKVFALPLPFFLLFSFLCVFLFFPFFLFSSEKR